MSAARAVEHPLRSDLCAALRQMVEAGEPDGPVVVVRDGRPIMQVRSLHAAALLTVTEEPRPRFAPWTPHPRASVGPRIQALLIARAARKLRARS